MTRLILGRLSPPPSPPVPGWNFLEREERDDNYPRRVSRAMRFKWVAASFERRPT